MSYREAFEVSPPLDPLREEEFLSLVNSVANHEGKLLTAAIICARPDVWFTRTSLRHAVVSCQGDEPGWKVSKVLPTNYCDESLGPNGVVTIGTVEGRVGQVKAVRATEFGARWVLAFAGGILEWSLDYPDKSVQKLSGASNTQGSSRAPEKRLDIFTELVTSPNKELTFTEIADSLGKDDKRVSAMGTRLNDLRRLGIVAVNSKVEHFNPVFEVVDPTYRHLSRGLEEISVPMQVIYRAMNDLQAAGTTTISLEEMVLVCGELDTDVDLQKVRYNLVEAAGNRSQLLPGPQVTDRNGAPVQRNLVRLVEDYEEPVYALVSRIEELKDPSNIPHFSQVARDILASPEDCRAIMAKAKQFSSGYSGAAEGTAVLHERIKRIVTERGPLSALAVQSILANDGLERSCQTVWRALKSMHEAEALDVEVVKVDPTRKLKVKVYSVKEEAPND